MKISLKKLGRWALARSKEKTTYSGLALVAAAVGLPKAASTITAIGDAAQAIGLTSPAGALTGAGIAAAVAAKVIGVGLAAASTKPHDAG